jgi:hypothetical protein
MAQEPPASRFRAFTTSLGLHPATSRSSSDQSSTQSFPPSHAQSLFGNFTLFLRVHSAQHLPAVTQSSYCKVYLGASPLIGGFGQGKALVGADRGLGSSHQTFHTKVQSSSHKDSPEWNEKFQLSVRNPNTEVLTIRVKSHVLIYSPAVGACVVHLRQLQPGVTIDEWFPLFKNDKPAGQLRLQLCLQENVPTPAPERRYSQPSEELIQRLMQENRELEEAKRRQVELQQERKWKQMEEDAVKRVGLQEQVEREEIWRQQLVKRDVEQQQSRSEDSDSDMLPSFKYRGVKTEQAQTTQLMGNLSLQAGVEDANAKATREAAIPSGYAINRVDSRAAAASFADGTTGFGTIRMSVEEMEQVVQNALPTSESSESSSSEREQHRRRKDRNNKKRSQRKKHRNRRANRDDEFSDSSSASWRGSRKGSSRLKTPEEEAVQKRATADSVSSSDSKRGNQVPITLSFPPSPSEDSSSSFSSEEERRHRHRRAKRRKERRRTSKRKGTKSRCYDDSSDSSSLSQSAESSSSLSSSEEERLRRKLKKKARARKAKARAKLAESGGSRASTRALGRRDGPTASRGVAYSPSLVQRRGPPGADSLQADESQLGGEAARYGSTNVRGSAASTAPTTSFASSSAQQQQLYGSKADVAYGPDGVGFDEPGQPATQQYLGQTTTEQTNAALMRSFCF